MTPPMLTKTDRANPLAAFPLQAYLFANLISLFAFSGYFLREATNFWCLMTVVLAVGVGICYFLLGWACNTVSFVSDTPLDKENLTN